MKTLSLLIIFTFLLLNSFLNNSLFLKFLLYLLLRANVMHILDHILKLAYEIFNAISTADFFFLNLFELITQSLEYYFRFFYSFHLLFLTFLLLQNVIDQRFDISFNIFNTFLKIDKDSFLFLVINQSYINFFIFLDQFLCLFNISFLYLSQINFIFLLDTLFIFFLQIFIIRMLFIQFSHASFKSI